MSGIRRHADNLVRYKGPTAVSGGTVLDVAAGASSTFKVLDDAKEQEVAAAVTRLRSAAAAFETDLEIPHIIPQWLTTNDSIHIELADGSTMQTFVVVVTPGTDEGTPATNFDTLTISVLGLDSAAVAGAKITLVHKAAPNVVIPVKRHVDPFELGDNVEAELDAVPGTLDVQVVSQIQKTTHTEDGEIATNQEAYDVVTLASGFSGAVSAGRRLRNTLGADVTMSEYGTVTAGSADWGFEGTLADSYAGLETGKTVKLEIHFNGGGGFKDVVSMVEPVVEA